jgi:hypothetical protein
VRPATSPRAALDVRLSALAARVRPLAAPAGLLVLALAAAYNMADGPARFGWADFHSFYAAGVDVRTGIDPYLGALRFVRAYHPALSGSLFATQAYVYAPFFAVLMAPLSLLSSYAALTVWDLLNVGFLVLAVWAALRSAGVRPSAGLLLLLAAAGAVTLPLHREWSLGQSDVLVMALLTTSLWARSAGRSALAGLLLGAGAAIKPELLLLAAYLLWRREFRYALTTVAATAVLALAPFALLARSAWGHFWQVWGFWANQYLPFIHNEAPKGVLTRLFTVNPVSRPLVDAPGAVTALWLVIVIVVLGLTLAVSGRRRLRRDPLSLLEVGLALEAIMLVSPLTERPYFLLLLVPLLGLLCWLRQTGLRGRRVRRAALAALLLWVSLVGPAEVWEYALDPGLLGRSRGDALFVLLAPAYMWVTVAAFVLQLVVVARLRGVRVLPAAGEALRRAPFLIAEWARDAGSALGRAG